MIVADFNSVVNARKLQSKMSVFSFNIINILDVICIPCADKLILVFKLIICILELQSYFNISKFDDVV